MSKKKEEEEVGFVEVVLKKEKRKIFKIKSYIFR